MIGKDVQHVQTENRNAPKQVEVPPRHHPEVKSMFLMVFEGFETICSLGATPAAQVSGETFLSLNKEDKHAL